ncbi:MAG: hypothetical protein ACYDH6_12885 [Acidimicrobiales bacterium]
MTIGDNEPVKMWDVLTPRRLITTALLLLAGVIAVYGMQHVADQRAATCGGGDTSASPVRQLYPCPGDDGLRQGRIGVSLAQGYTADLSVDGQPIPKDQMIIEGTDFLFLPGPDKQTGALAPGPHRASIVYYRLLQDPAQGTTYTWSFTTH